MELGTYKVYRNRHTQQYEFYGFKHRVINFFSTLWYWMKVGTGVTALIVVAASVGWMVRGNEVSALVNYTNIGTTTVKTIVQNEDEVLHAIGDCESGNGTKGSRRQFLPNGNVVTHTNSNGSVDLGMYEINMTAAHIIQMAKMHIDPMTEEGNFAEAKYIHNTEGVQPWSASQHCWIKLI